MWIFSWQSSQNTSSAMWVPWPLPFLSSTTQCTWCDDMFLFVQTSSYISGTFQDLYISACQQETMLFLIGTFLCPLYSNFNDRGATVSTPHWQVESILPNALIQIQLNLQCACLRQGLACRLHSYLLTTDVTGLTAWSHSLIWHLGPLQASWQYCNWPWFCSFLLLFSVSSFAASDIFWGHPKLFPVTFWFVLPSV